MRLLPKWMPKVRAWLITIQTICRTREAVEAKLQRGNGILPRDEGRSLDDVHTNRAIPHWGREERSADNVLRVECKVREQQGGSNELRYLSLLH
jgi:hypothetical protein